MFFFTVENIIKVKHRKRRGYATVRVAKNHTRNEWGRCLISHPVIKRVWYGRGPGSNGGRGQYVGDILQFLLSIIHQVLGPFLSEFHLRTNQVSGHVLITLNFTRQGRNIVLYVILSRAENWF